MLSLENALLCIKANPTVFYLSVPTDSNLNADFVCQVWQRRTVFNLRMSEIDGVTRKNPLQEYVEQMCGGSLSESAQSSASPSSRFSSGASALQNWEEFYGKSQEEVSHQMWPCMERSWADRVCVAEAPSTI